MQRENLLLLLLVPFFFAIEFTRAALWTARTIDEPDRDGPLLRALIALVVGVLSIVPRPIWTLVTYIVWLALMPIRSVLWLFGIGRAKVKKGSSHPVWRWYARRARRLQRRREAIKDELDE